MKIEFEAPEGVKLMKIADIPAGTGFIDCDNDPCVKLDDGGAMDAGGVVWEHDPDSVGIVLDCGAPEDTDGEVLRGEALENMEGRVIVVEVTNVVGCFEPGDEKAVGRTGVVESTIGPRDADDGWTAWVCMDTPLPNRERYVHATAVKRAG